MPGPRELLIGKLSRIQSFGEKTLFFVDEPSRPRAASADATGGAPDATDIEVGAPDTAGEVGAPDAADAEVDRRWRELEARVSVCTLCRLCETRTHAVFGSGTRHTRLFILGEGPGEQEDRQAEAFVGPAGQLLTKILKSVGFERDQVFITNIVKCRPPRNRAPLPDEATACAPYLRAQLEMVDPVVILTLGASATHSLLGIAIPISKLRGRVHLHQGIPVIPTYHPAALLRNPEYKRPTWEDVQLLRRVYDEGLARRAAVPSSAAGSKPPEPAAAPQLELGA